jgi:hypothetical protein
MNPRLLDGGVAIKEHPLRLVFASVFVWISETSIRLVKTCRGVPLDHHIKDLPGWKCTWSCTFKEPDMHDGRIVTHETNVTIPIRS